MTSSKQTPKNNIYCYLANTSSETGSSKVRRFPFRHSVLLCRHTQREKSVDQTINIASPSARNFPFLSSWSIRLSLFPYPLPIAFPSVSCGYCRFPPCFTVVKFFTSWYALFMLFFLRFSSVSLHCSPIQFSLLFSCTLDIIVHFLVFLKSFMFKSFLSQFSPFVAQINNHCSDPVFFFFWRCLPRISLAVSITAVLKAVIIESRSVASLSTIVRGANLPPAIAWKGSFPAHLIGNIYVFSDRVTFLSFLSLSTDMVISELVVKLINGLKWHSYTPEKGKNSFHWKDNWFKKSEITTGLPAQKSSKNNSSNTETMICY